MDDTLPGGGVTPIGFGGYARAMTAGPDGNVWLTHSSRSSVIRMTPQGEITEFKRASSGRNHRRPGREHLVHGGLGAICRISVVGDVVQFPLPRAPIGIVTGPDGNLWFTEFDGTCNCPGGELPLPVAIGRLTPGGSLTHYPFGEAAGIIIGPDRNLWCTGGSSTGLGRVTPRALRPPS